jgi:hypothetical protein
VHQFCHTVLSQAVLLGWKPSCLATAFAFFASGRFRRNFSMKGLQEQK